jgi:hypothetical protein
MRNGVTRQIKGKEREKYFVQGTGVWVVVRVGAVAIENLLTHFLEEQQQRDAPDRSACGDAI